MGQKKATCVDRYDPLPGTPLKLIVANEFAERFCFYGTRSLLVLYLTEGLHFSEPQAVTGYSIYMGLCYLSPLLGGYVADVYLGRFLTIAVFNVLYLCGVAIWGGTAFVNALAGCIVGLFLMGAGTGGIKPNISPFGADQFVGASDRQLMSCKCQVPRPAASSTRYITVLPHVSPVVTPPPPLSLVRQISSGFTSVSTLGLLCLTL
jgi:hypothetical protein